MKNASGYFHNTGLLILRLLLASVFLFHVLPKFGAGPELVTMIGGAPYNMGLTFLNQAMWFYLLIVAELFIVVTLLFGVRTRLGSIIMWIILFFALALKQRALPAIELDLVLAGIGIVLFVAGPGRYSMMKGYSEDMTHKN